MEMLWFCYFLKTLWVACEYYSVLHTHTLWFRSFYVYFYCTIFILFEILDFEVGKARNIIFFGLDFYLFSSPFCMLLAHDRSIKFLFLQTYRNPFTRQPSCMHLCICIVKNKKTTYSIAFLYKIVFSNTISFFFTK